MVRSIVATSWLVDRHCRLGIRAVRRSTAGHSVGLRLPEYWLGLSVHWLLRLRLLEPLLVLRRPLLSVYEQT
jgi:hypothetical protein